MATSELKDWQLSFLTRKVSRRIFIVCIFCTLVPFLVLAVFSFSQVMDQLYEQGQRQLRQSNKALGISIVDRLSFLENELKVFSSIFTAIPGASRHGAAEGYSKSLKRRFKALALVTNSGKCIPVLGHIQNPGEQSEEEKQHLRVGKTLVSPRFSADNRAHIYMMRAVDPQDPKQGTLCGEINSMYLWGLSEFSALPSMTELCVLDQSNNIIYSTIPLPPVKPIIEHLAVARSSSGSFVWKYEDKEYLASFWSIFLKPKFLYPKWTIVLSTSKDYILAPMAYFKKIFPVVISLSVLVVLLVSIILIRKIMRPLEEFKEGTQRHRQ